MITTSRNSSNYIGYTMHIFTKSIEKKSVFVVPTGNNYVREDHGTAFDQVSEATVDKVTSKFVNLTVTSVYGHKQEKRVRILDTNRLSNDCDGYLVFLTMSDFNDYLVSEKTRKTIRDNINSMSVSDLLKITKALGL
jgi:hypothetical protein